MERKPKRKKLLSQEEINKSLHHLLMLTEKELEAIVLNEQAPMFEKTVGKAIQEGYKDGSMDVLEKILNRTIGKPRESVKPEGGQTLTIVQPKVIDTGLKIAESEEEIVEF